VHTANDLVYRFHSEEQGATYVVTPQAGAGGTLDPSVPQDVAAGETAAFEVLARFVDFRTSRAC
jgi:hypothetical protein